jgi:hypothetical protein
LDTQLLCFCVFCRVGAAAFFSRRLWTGDKGDSRVFLYLEFRMGRTYMVDSLFFDALLALEGERGGEEEIGSTTIWDGVRGKDERRSSIAWACTDVFETNETTVRAFVSLHTNHVCIQ